MKLNSQGNKSDPNGQKSQAMSLNYFQTAGKLTIALNFLLPLISVTIAKMKLLLDDQFSSFDYTSTQYSPGLSICLGEGYRTFFSTELPDMCNHNNSIGKYACKLWFLIQAILMSNLIDIYLIYFIIQAINRQNEASKSIIGVNAYISRKKCVYLDYTILTFCSL